MRPPVDSERIRALARALAEVAHEDVTLYLTGGATAVIEGWRPTTIDVDIRLEPDSDALMRRIVSAKSDLDINVELASPPDFIPELPGWRQRSPFVLREGRITVRHFDLYSQALSKIERGFAKDLDDVAAMIGAGLVVPARAVRGDRAAVAPVPRRRCGCLPPQRLSGDRRIPGAPRRRATVAAVRLWVEPGRDWLWLCILCRGAE